MRFKVPQFIEMESKIVGPLTFKQVVYIGGGLGISYIRFKILPVIIAIPIAGIILLFVWALAFYPKRKLGKPFIEITEAAIKYMAKDKLYTWKRTNQGLPPEKQGGFTERDPLLSIPKVLIGKLDNISKNLEIGPEIKEGEETV